MRYCVVQVLHHTLFIRKKVLFVLDAAEDDFVRVFPWHALVPCMIRHMSTQTAQDDNSNLVMQKDDVNHNGNYNIKTL